jgi:hypothetical protein
MPHLPPAGFEGTSNYREVQDNGNVRDVGQDTWDKQVSSTENWFPAAVWF